MQKCRSIRRTAARLLSLSAAVVLSASLAGCAHSRMTTGSISRDGSRPVDQMSAPELQATAGALGKRYAADPSDKPTALRYASVAADERRHRPGACGHAQIGHRLPQGPRRARRLRQVAGRSRPVRTRARRGSPRPDPRISGLEAGLRGRRDPRPDGQCRAGARPLSQGARPEAERAVGAFQPRHVLRA